MGTHPIFESDFDCLTVSDFRKWRRRGKREERREIRRGRIRQKPRPCWTGCRRMKRPKNNLLTTWGASKKSLTGKGRNETFSNWKETRFILFGKSPDDCWKNEKPSYVTRIAKWKETRFILFGKSPDDSWKNEKPSYVTRIAKW